MNIALLLRQRARRDWLQVLLWVVGTALLAYASWVGVDQSYGTEQDRINLLLTVLANPVILLFRGLPSGPGEAAFMLFLIFPFLAMLAGFMSSFLAVRHTRADEETGRSELLAASGAGRRAPLLATIVHGMLANLLLAVAVALTFIAAGFEPSGSWVSGLGAAGVGVSMLGVGLFAAQLMPTSRGANSLSVWVLLLTFLGAGLGNALGSVNVDELRIESGWLVWLSPFGWAEQSRPFADNALWPLVLTWGFGLLLAGVSLRIQVSRDLGASLLPERRGRATASRSLSGVFGLAWRLNRGAVVGWTIGGLLTGLLATTLTGVLQDAADQNPTVTAILQAMTAQADLTQAAIIVFFTMLGILAAAAAVQVITKARQEEAHGTTELLLTSPAGRLRWFGSYVCTAVLAILATVAGAVGGAALGIAGQPTPSWALMRDVVVVASGQLVAASVFAALTLLVFVLAPRLTIGLGWTLVMVGMTLGLFGPLFGMPRWLVDLAPISAVATVSGDSVELKSTLGFVVFVAVAVLASFALMRRRELVTE